MHKLVRKIFEEGIGEHVNIGGELFQRILVDRDESAAFYTTASTAELLAALTIQGSDRKDWRREDLFSTLRIADLACGTGTLLRSAYLRVKGLHERHNRRSNLKNFHCLAMQNGIIGADISLLAAHMSNSNLASVGEGESYGDTNIGQVLLGNKEADGIKGSIGTLEFLEKDMLGNMLMEDISEMTSGGKRDGYKRSLLVGDNSMDYVIMNPPYTRSGGQVGSFDIEGVSKEERTSCQERWKKLIRRTGAKAMVSAGMAASFLCIAYKRVRPGGRIGFVLPLTAASGTSWKQTRRMIERNFDDILVVTGKGRSLSADTNMNEMLLVATKRHTPRPPSGDGVSIYCANIEEMPSRVGESSEFAKSILYNLANLSGDHKTLLMGDSEVGAITKFQSEEGETWSHVGGRNVDLSLSATMLVKEGMLKDFMSGEEVSTGLPMMPMEEIFDIGPGGDRIGHLYTSEKVRAWSI